MGGGGRLHFSEMGGMGERGGGGEGGRGVYLTLERHQPKFTECLEMGEGKWERGDGKGEGVLGGGRGDSKRGGAASKD